MLPNAPRLGDRCEMIQAIIAGGKKLCSNRRREQKIKKKARERKRRWGKIRSLMVDREIDCLIIVEASFPNRMEEIAIRTGHLTPRLLKKELLKITQPERILSCRRSPLIVACSRR
jgi:hypothetical protein